MQVKSSRFAAESKKTDDNGFVALLFVILLFVASIFFVGISGDFPLNDDWSYATAVRNFVATGSWKPLYNSMTLLTNALWAFPFCALTSCSFEVLRVSSLIAAAALFIATFYLLRLNSKGVILPIAAALLIAFNPIVYCVSFTFMTDTVFAAFVTLSGLVFVLSLKRDSGALVALGTALAIAATLSRQLGLAVPLAFLIARPLQSGPWPRKLLMAILPFVFTAASYALYNHWLRETGREPALYNAYTQLIASKRLSEMAFYTVLNWVSAIQFLGLFSLPMLLATGPALPAAGVRGKTDRIPMICATAIAVLATVNVVARRHLMPLFGNFVGPHGLGPLTLPDTFTLHLDNVPSLGPIFWGFVTILSIWGAFELVARVATFFVTAIPNYWRRCLSSEEASAVMAILVAVITIAVVSISFVYDRYILPPLPLLFFFIAGTATPGPVRTWRAASAAALILAMAVFAVLGTRDYMTWQRARWLAIADIQKSGVAGPHTIDGGYEYNGLFIYDPSYRAREGKSFWWVDKDDYLITFGPVEGLKVVGSYPYETLMPPAKRSILVLKRP